MIAATTRNFQFRLKAVARGGAVEYTEPIEIKAFNCDYQGPVFVKVEKIVVSELIDLEKDSLSFDVSKMFKAQDKTCPIKKF